MTRRVSSSLPAALLVFVAACFDPASKDGDTTAAEDSSSEAGATTSSSSSDGSSDAESMSTTLGTESSSSAEDSSSGGADESGESSSTGGAPTVCDPSTPFGDIRLLDELSAADDEGSVSLAPDELTIYYFTNELSPGTPDLDAYVATRASLDEPFSNATLIEAVQSGADERGGWITRDQLSFYFYSSRDAVTHYDVWVSSRASVAAPFGMPEKLGAAIDTEANEQGPHLAPDGSALYFDREGAIYRSQLGGNGFADPIPVGELNDGGADNALLTFDGLTIYFTSSRPGGAGNLDIWRATRDAADGVFGDIVNVSDLNLDDFEFADWISDDACRLYLTSRRPGGEGGWDIWVAERAP